MNFGAKIPRFSCGPTERSEFLTRWIKLGSCNISVKSFFFILFGLLWEFNHVLQRMLWDKRSSSSHTWKFDTLSAHYLNVSQWIPWSHCQQPHKEINGHHGLHLKMGQSTCHTKPGGEYGGAGNCWMLGFTIWWTSQIKFRFCRVPELCKTVGINKIRTLMNAKSDAII